MKRLSNKWQNIKDSYLQHKLELAILSKKTPKILSILKEDKRWQKYLIVTSFHQNESPALFSILADSSLATSFLKTANSEHRTLASSFYNDAIPVD